MLPKSFKTKHFVTLCFTIKYNKIILITNIKLSFSNFILFSKFCLKKNFHEDHTLHIFCYSLSVYSLFVCLFLKFASRVSIRVSLFILFLFLYKVYSDVAGKEGVLTTGGIDFELGIVMAKAWSVRHWTLIFACTGHVLYHPNYHPGSSSSLLICRKHQHSSFACPNLKFTHSLNDAQLCIV